MEETSLEEFVGSKDEERDAQLHAEVEPAAVTSRTSPEGEECESCERPTGRLWNDDGSFVCRSCKEW